MRTLIALLLAAAGFALGWASHRPDAAPVILEPAPIPVHPLPSREDVTALQKQWNEQEVLIASLRKEVANLDRCRAEIEAELARRPKSPEDRLAALIAARKLNPDDLKRLDACRKAFHDADGATSIEKSKELVKWISVGDPEEWVRYVFGPEDRTRTDPDKPDCLYLYYYVPHQDVILVKITGGKAEEILRAWKQGKEG